MKPVTKAFSRILSVLFATLAGAALLGLWVARHLAKPLLKLTEGTKTIAAEHFDAQVVVTSRDEIGVPANAFNHMADALDVTLSALKREVAERTAGSGVACPREERTGAARKGTHRATGRGNRRTQTGRGSLARQRGTIKRIFQCVPDRHVDAGPATAVFKS